MNLNDVEYYYIRNAQGDIIGLFDKDGTTVVKYTYDSWGKLISIEGSLKDSVGVKNPYRYRGYRYDSETGLYYLQSRYYNPEWGRFINADGLVGTLGELLSPNMFAYCGNNPINREDPNGYIWDYIKEFVAQLGNAINTLKSSYAFAGGCALGDGPLPFGDAAGLLIAGATTVVATGVAIYNTSKISTQSTNTSTTITAATDIPISNRKSGSYYPAYVDNYHNTVAINFFISMNLVEAQNYVHGGNDVYTFTQYNAQILAIKTGGKNKVENHINSDNSRPGLYFNHFHGKGLGGERVHIFFDLPKVKR